MKILDLLLIRIYDWLLKKVCVGLNEKERIYNKPNKKAINETKGFASRLV